MFTHILLATDGSEYALEAARLTAEIARKFESTVTVLCVFQPPVAIPNVASEATPIDSQAIARYADEVLADVMRRTGKVLDEAGVGYTARCEQGHPVDVIVSVAARAKVDLIMMGSRGMGRMESFLLGSVSDRVLHHAHCPVLIAK
jgi:nucleotide-binding universal stress UspA family protein